MGLIKMSSSILLLYRLKFGAMSQKKSTLIYIATPSNSLSQWARDLLILTRLYKYCILLVH